VNVTLEICNFKFNLLPDYTAYAKYHIAKATQTFTLAAAATATVKGKTNKCLYFHIQNH